MLISFSSCHKNRFYSVTLMHLKTDSLFLMRQYCNRCNHSLYHCSYSLE